MLLQDACNPTASIRLTEDVGASEPSEAGKLEHATPIASTSELELTTLSTGDPAVSIQLTEAAQRSDISRAMSEEYVEVDEEGYEADESGGEITTHESEGSDGGDESGGDTVQ